eukprot:COSAG05_NODE_15_length_36348_cov_78.369307_10_plen_574_part_00
MFSERQARRQCTRGGAHPPLHQVAHLVAMAEARLSGEGEACRLRAATDADNLTNKMYCLLAAQELSTWRLLQRYLSFSNRQGQDARVAWMAEVLSWLEHGAADASAIFGGQHTNEPRPADAGTVNQALREVWKHVRSGDVPAAQACCRNSGEWWRAASLAPARGDGTGSGLAAWQRASHLMATDADAPQLERVIYAALCAEPAVLDVFRSNSESGVHSVLRTWHDKLFVWVKIWVDHHNEVSSSRSPLNIPPREEVQRSLNDFLRSCDAKTAEEILADEFANAVGLRSSVVKSWVMHALCFFRDLQQHLILNIPGQTHTGAEYGTDVPQLLARAPDGVFPDCLRFHTQRDAARSLPSDLQQLGSDLSSQVTRISLHAGLLLSNGSSGRSLSQNQFVQGLVTEYLHLLVSVAEECSDDLLIISEYATWLSTSSQPAELSMVLRGMNTACWKHVLCQASSLDALVVAEVQQTLVRGLRLDSNAACSEMLEALEWSCSSVVADSAGGLLARLTGLRETNDFMRAQMLEEGNHDSVNTISALYTDAAVALCLNEQMNAQFAEICEKVRLHLFPVDLV